MMHEFRFDVYIYIFIYFIYINVHPGRSTWNLKTMVWKMIFLFKYAIFGVPYEFSGVYTWFVVSNIFGFSPLPGEDSHFD